MSVKEGLVVASLILGVLALGNAIQGQEEAQQPELKVGDKAPELKVAKWVKGEAVDLKAGKGEKVYVVEFWATWCGPCRASIPHLTELQKEMNDRGVEILGISTEKAETVKKFVEAQGDKMGYTVAVDDNRKTAKAWMEAAGQDGIPHAFIVDKEGKIAWHGNPLRQKSNTLILNPELKATLDRLAPAKSEEKTPPPLKQGAEEATANLPGCCGGLAA